MTCCGYSFCHVCIVRIKAKNISCPCCKAEEFDHYPNKGLKRSLNEFKVQCSNYQQGCQWEGELGQLDNHLNYNPTEDKQLKGCQFSKIKCVHCPDSILRSHIRTHQSDQCPKRPFSCKHCKDFDSSYEDVTTNHWPVCGYYPLPCPNKCGKTLQRQNLHSHITNDCPLTIIDCDFQHVGCEVTLPRKDMPTHLQEGVVCHVSLQAESYKKDMMRLEEENKILKQRVVKLTKDLNIYKICTLLCPLELIMTNYYQRKEAEELWRSPPFYTHQMGYKLCLLVDASGKHFNKGTHIAIYIKLMKGDYDSQLCWPFRGTIKIKILDQCLNRQHYTMIVMFDKSDAGVRVTEGDESHSMLGWNDCISHDNFMLLATVLREGCLRFRIKCINVA